MKKLLMIIAFSLPVWAFAQERALVNLDTGEVIEYQTKSKAPQGTPTQWKKVIRGERPSIDRATQKLVRSVDGSGSSVSITWSAVDLNQSELDAKSDQAARQAEQDTRRAQLKAAMTALKENTATISQMRTILYRLLRQQGYEE